MFLLSYPKPKSLLVLHSVNLNHTAVGVVSWLCVTMQQCVLYPDCVCLCSSGFYILTVCETMQQCFFFCILTVCDHASVWAVSWPCDHAAVCVVSWLGDHASVCDVSWLCCDGGTCLSQVLKLTLAFRFLFLIGQQIQKPQRLGISFVLCIERYPHLLC